MPDPNGSIKERCLTYLDRHPNALYEDVKAACFPGMKDDYRFDAIGPRLFEAAATRTCQVLIKDEYLGLEPYQDYVPLEEDFSNLPEVFEILRNPELLGRVADSAHRKLIASKRFSFETFVREILDSIPARADRSPKIFGLIERHFEELRPFAALDKELGSLTAQTTKRAAQRKLRNRPAANLADAIPEPRISAVATLLREDSFPSHPEFAIRSQMLANWSAEHEVDVRRILAGASEATLLSKSLETWGFCECIYDASRGDDRAAD
jgi:hypothetical protein